MDLNLKIIGAIKECPLLYQGNTTIPERRRQWRQLADQLKLQERFLKSRWYFLRERFQREFQNCQKGREANGNGFKYSKEMEFLVPFMRNVSSASPTEEENLPVNVIKPEFVITEKDLENDCGNEEYVFLEVEALEEDEARGEETETTLEIDTQISSESLEQRTDEHQQDVQSENGESNQTNPITEQQVEAEVDASKQGEHKSSAKAQKCTNAVTLNDTDIIIKTEAETDVGAIEESDKQVDLKALTSQLNRPHDIKMEFINNNSERGEDDIFGELVSAMLKRMPTEKKRATKKEIMNLLLT